jgi:serine/threonine protein kinase
MFGAVYLCLHKTKKVFYALKTVPRVKVDKFRIWKNLKAERELLLRLDHPMIMRLVKTFKDEARLYYLLEYIHGVDLFDAIREIGVLRDDQAKFYIGCLVLALEHLADRDIIHRDLKPENVMVDN